MEGRCALFAWYNLYLADATSSYFSQKTRALPMMHLWYMGVLIQSYALFAVLLYLWHRFKCSKRMRVASLAVLGLLSLCLQFRWCIHEFGGDASYAASTYYWTSTRIWEFSAGALAYLLPSPASNSKAASRAALLCLASLAAACFVPVPESTRWVPVAVLLCMVVIKCGGFGAAGAILGCRPLELLGTISFSLYLMHWPVVCFAEYLFNTGVQGWDLLPVSLLILLLGTALYQVAEKPRFPFPVIVALWCAGVLSCSLPAKCHRFLERLHPLPAAAEHPAEGGELAMAEVDKPLLRGTEAFEVNTWGSQVAQLPPMFYHLGDTGRQPNFVLLGDSHATHFASAFSALGRKHGWSGVYLNAYVHPFWNSIYESTQAPDHNWGRGKAEDLLSWLSLHPQIKYVFIAQWWTYQHNLRHKTWDGKRVTAEQALLERPRELEETCRRLRAIGKVPVILAETPTIKTSTPMRVGQRMQLYGDFLCRSRSNIECSQEQFVKDTAVVQRMFDSLERDGLALVLHEERALFKNGLFQVCGHDGECLMDDHNHLAPAAAYMAVESVADAISRILQMGK